MGERVAKRHRHLDRRLRVSRGVPGFGRFCCCLQQTAEQGEADCEEWWRAQARGAVEVGGLLAVVLAPCLLK